MTFRVVCDSGQVDVIDIPVKNTFLHVPDNWFPDAQPLVRHRTWPCAMDSSTLDGTDDGTPQDDVSTDAGDAEHLADTGLLVPPHEASEPTVEACLGQRSQLPTKCLEPLLPHAAQPGAVRDAALQDDADWIQVVRGGRRKGGDNSTSDSSEHKSLTAARQKVPCPVAPPSRRSHGHGVEVPVPPCSRHNTPAASSSSQKHGRKHDGRISREIHVGIEDDSEFHVVKRLLGPGGRHIQEIVAAQGGGVKIRVMGGRAPPEMHLDDKALPSEPVVVSVSAAGSGARDKVERAAKGIEELVERVSHEYRTFLERMQGRRSTAGSSQRWRGGGVQDARQGAYKCRYLVGIDDDSDFRVVRRLLGPGGENMQFIVAEAAEAGGRARVSVRGRGASRAAPGDRSGNDGPLEVILDATTEASFERSCELIEDMLQDIQDQRMDFCEDRGLPAPYLRVKRDMLCGRT
eukprot:TRINITY_DN100449_c0_g1_i1.p1 TRINITY_DN100449_c0_g1~~TRINITY_DN100449_c0_g1_i1.p1  ORF type:complete len:460 (-),score=87.99 TRINITY_DN100449_c0_g1_i1:464-1843(-)